MTPIESIHDVRLVTLIGVVIDVAEELALASCQDTDYIIARALYVANKNVHEQGEEKYMEHLQNHYPILKEAIN